MDENEKKNSGWYEPLSEDERASLQPEQEPQEDKFAAAERMAAEARERNAAAAAEKPKKKRGGFGRVALAILLVLVLLVSSSLLFAKLGRSSFNFTVNNNGDTHSFSFGGEPDAEEDEGEGKDEGFSLPFDIPGKPEIPGLPDMGDGGDSGDADYDGGEDMPGNKDDFFDSYFSPAENYDVNVDADKYEGKLNTVLEIDTERETKLTLQELYAKCSPSVVTIITYQNKIVEFGLGSGFIVTSDGLIITNTHVIDDCDRITVKLSDETVYEAKLVGFDGTSDVAVLKIDAKGLPAVTFGDSDALEIGEEVAAIGNPLSESFRLSLTNGIISGIDRGVNYNGRTMTVLQTNTALNNGNSGGPLFNMYGQVVGITNMKMTSTLTATIEGIGFAIPSRNALPIANALIDKGEVRGRTSIGITVGAVPEQAVEEYNIPFGLYITDVTPGTDAEAKGLMKGDIVTHVNGNEVRTTDDILNEKDGLLVGDSLTFTIFRESTGETFDVEVILMDTLDVYG